MESINKLAIGAGGFSASVVAQPLIETATADPSNIVQVVVQIIIAIATLVGMFKKKNNKS